MSWSGAFFALVGFFVLIAFFAALSAHDFASAAVLAVLGCGLPILQKATRL